MNRCNDLCTKETIGHCAVCDALAERDQFIRFWFQGGVLINGVQALKRRGVFTFLGQYISLFFFLFCIGLMLLLALLILVRPNQQLAVDTFLGLKKSKLFFRTRVALHFQ